MQLTWQPHPLDEMIRVITHGHSVAALSPRLRPIEPRAGAFYRDPLVLREEARAARRERDAHLEDAARCRADGMPVSARQFFDAATAAGLCAARLEEHANAVARAMRGRQVDRVPGGLVRVW